MARQTRTRQNDRGLDIAASPARRRSSGLNDDFEKNGESTTARGQLPAKRQRPLANRVEKGAKKPKQMASVAGVFQRPSKDTRRDKRGHRRKEHSPVPDLYHDFHDAMEDIRATIGNNMKNTFDNVYESLRERLMVSTGKDEKAFETISETAALLGASLVDEKISTTTKRDGKFYKKVVDIGEQIAAFKKTMEEEKSKLQDYWKQWDEVQNDYLELGIQVFGREAFNEDCFEGIENGYKKEMELLTLEHQTEVERLEEEVEEMSVEILEKIKKSEKDLDAAMKKEQAKLLQHLLA